MIRLIGHGFVRPEYNTKKHVFSREWSGSTAVASRLSPGVVLVVQPHPVAEIAAVIFVAALRCEIEIVIGADQRIAATSTRLERLEYVACVIPEEAAAARQIVRLAGHRGKVVG